MGLWSLEGAGIGEKEREVFRLSLLSHSGDSAEGLESLEVESRLCGKAGLEGSGRGRPEVTSERPSEINDYGRRN